MRKLILVVTLLVGASPMFSQVTSRSNSTYKVTGDEPGTLPCYGTPVFTEDFESGLPVGWEVFDFDGFTPVSGTGLSAGWHSAEDFRDETNTVMVSPSWYDPVGKSNDWLILSQMTVGSNTCFSWSAYSQDPYFAETYEVLISTAGTDTADFLANDALFISEGEAGEPTARSASLSDYAGQMVYIAFRHTMEDGFALVIDDLLTTEVQAVDAGVILIDTNELVTGTKIRIFGEFTNYGSEILETVDLIWTTSTGDTFTLSLDTLGLEPNQTCTYFFFNQWRPPINGTYELCVTSSNPNGVLDGEQANDSTCLVLNLTAVGIEDGVGQLFDLDVFPNPTSGTMDVKVEGLNHAGEFKYEILDLSGKLLLSENSIQPYQSLTLSHLSNGLYFVRVTEREQVIGISKFLKN